MMELPGTNTIELNMATMMQAIEKRLNEDKLSNAPHIFVTAMRFNPTDSTCEFDITTDEIVK